MTTFYNSTRNKSQKLTPSECILKGLSDDGGLFVTDDIDTIEFDPMQFVAKTYPEIATVILRAFLGDFSDEQIRYCVQKAYNTQNFETGEIFTMKHFSQYSYLELYRGNTIAFKDAALSILPHLMKCAKDNCGETGKITILTATSGDTGKAALEGFRNAEGIDVVVFYPYMGVSKLQLLQMLTQKGENVFSLALRGNFDDAQTNVKAIFNDREYNRKLRENGVVLSSANSINIGRLIPQIVYYYYSYAKLIENKTIQKGEKVNFVVPTGNFGNILAGYYAYKTGLPVNKFICASNDNNVLYDFFKTGRYDRNRPFTKTISPSMDILISSNLERLVYEMTQRDDRKLASLMHELKEKGEYTVDRNNPIFSMFYGGYATEDEIRSAIRDSFTRDHYLIDTHTACAYKACRDYIRDTGDTTHNVILSTASPFKFSKDVYECISDSKQEDEIRYMYALSSLTSIPLPDAVNGIETRPRKEETVIYPKDMKEEILKIVKR